MSLPPQQREQRQDNNDGNISTADAANN